MPGSEEPARDQGFEAMPKWQNLKSKSRRLDAVGPIATPSYSFGGIMSRMDNEGLNLDTARDVKRFDRWAPTYDRSPLQKLYFEPVHAAMLDLLARELKEAPGFIVDVGCGTGRLLRAASARWPEARLFGVDPAEQMLSVAARLNPCATFQLAPAETLPFSDQTADLAFSSLSFHHWSNQARGVQEIARVLRPGGFFCLADHRFLLSRLFGGKVKSAREIRALMTSAGLAVRMQKGLGIRFVLITLAQK